MMVRWSLLLSLVACASCVTVPSDLDWPRDLALDPSSLRPVKMNAYFAVPEFPVSINGHEVSLELDTGTPHGFLITNRQPGEFGLEVLGTTRELNADGSDRGANSLRVRAEAVEVLGVPSRRVEGTIADSRIYSNRPFEGLMSPELLGPVRLTVDYPHRFYSLSSQPIPASLDPRVHGVVPLLPLPERFQGNVYFLNTVNGEPAVTYLDTGASHSSIDEGLVTVNNLSWHQRGPDRVCDHVGFTIGGKSFVMKNVTITRISRNLNFPHPVKLTLGMDFLRDYVLTLDRVGVPVLVISDAQ